MISLLTFSKGHYFVISVGGVAVFTLCTSSDSALYLYQVFHENIPLGFRVTEWIKFSY